MFNPRPFTRHEDDLVRAARRAPFGDPCTSPLTAAALIAELTVDEGGPLIDPLLNYPTALGFRVKL